MLPEVAAIVRGRNASGFNKIALAILFYQKTLVEMKFCNFRNYLTKTRMKEGKDREGI